MDIEKIREAYHAQPFQPYYLVLSDGRKFEVYDDCCVAISPKGTTMIVVERRGRWHFLETAKVTHLEFLTPTVQKSSEPAA